MKKPSVHASRRPLLAATALALTLLISGCATVQEPAEPAGGTSTEQAAPPPAPLVERQQAESTAGTNAERADTASAATDPGRRKLAEGVELYEAGNFAGAIRVLSAPEIEQSDSATRVEAGKYLAFSYCVTNRRTLCRRTFDRVLTIDSGFALKPAEAGHPLWGPVFVQARKAADKRAN